MIRRRTASPHPFLLSLSLLGVSLVAGAACSATKTNTFTTGTGGGATSATSGPTTSASTTGAGGMGGDPVINPTGGGSDAGVEECASATAIAELVPVNIFITVDKSGSMLGAKWESAKQAFTTFFTSPGADPLRIALRFWPEGLCDDGACKLPAVEACGTPMVAIGPLSDPLQEQALVDAWNSTNPDGSTPTSIALQGATKWAANYVIAHNHAEAAVVLMVTDGEPSACNQDPVAIAKIADVAYQGAGVLTFAMGMPGANQQGLDLIAAAGHTGQAIMIGNGNAVQELLDALKAIQAGVVACSFPMPKAPDPKDIVDPTQVDVKFTPTVGPAVTFPEVMNVGQCTAAGGWYYDDPVMPTKITLCPASCGKAQSDPGSKIEIVLGCIKHVD